jgi:hypothetical protein
MFGRLLERYRRRRFAWLFVALLATIGARPVLDAFGSDRDLFEPLLAASLAMAAVGLARERGMRWLVALTAALVAVRGADIVLAADSLRAAGRLLWTAALALAAIASVRHALRPGDVDEERIFAALDAYLIVGLLFAIVFWMLETMHPGSYGGALAGGTLDIRAAIYLSFVTISTVGYGDILPVSDAARGLAIVEAVGGQMYLAVLVARLVGLYARQDART